MTKSAATQVAVVRCSMIQLCGYLADQLVQPSVDIVTEFGLVVEQTAACRQTGDLFAKPLAAVELELVVLERWMCSAAWLAVAAALDSGTIGKVAKM